MTAICQRVGLATLLIALLAPVATAQQTGTIGGVVRDPQGGVLPGVTVTVRSDALVSGSQVVVTGEAGAYQFPTLPPGTYSVNYELTGFTPLRREGIVVQVARTTRLDVDLSVGALQETVTVSGESPVVDTSSTVTQTNINKDLYEAIPTGRNPWTMAGLVPGVVTGRLDVGGTEGAQQYNIEAFGSADSQKSFSIDGLKVNWAGGSGGATMMYYGFEMYDEYNMQTASGTAESDVSGVFMNMVTKSGGNRFASDHNFYFMNEAMQGTNLDDELRARLGLQPGQQSGAAGNPIDISYDWSSTLGGPIRRDKAWFFGAIRWWRLDQFQIGAFNPDGSQAIDDNRIRNFMGKGTWQMRQGAKASFLLNKNINDRFHRRNAPYLIVEDKATGLQEQPAQNYLVQWNQVIGSRGILDARFGRMWGIFPFRFQKDVRPTDIAIRDQVLLTRINSVETQSDNPNHRYQAAISASYFLQSARTGTHDLKAGVQFSRERVQYLRIRNGDYFLELRDGAPLQAVLSNTPIDSDHRLNTWGVFLQDRWVVGRATINAGVRMDGVDAFLPAQASPAGAFIGERSFPKADVFSFPFNIAPRFGLSYDVRGNGRMAVKAYYGRFYNQFGSQIAEAANPNAIVDVAVSWADPNGNRALDPGELGTFTGFPRGLFPTVDTDATRPYSEEFNVGVEHQLGRDMALSASYHGRHHRNGLAILDRARGPEAYTPVARTYTDPITGQVQPIIIYSLRPEFINARDRYISNVELLRSDYNGVQFDFQKRMARRWQMLAGLSLQEHKGYDHSSTYTGVDMSNPNTHINRDDGSVFIDLPWTFTLSGSYMLPYNVMVSGKYTARAGEPLNRLVTFGGLPPSQVSESIRLVQRGVDRTEDVTKFIDIRFAKRVRIGTTTIEPTLDLFNVLNANHVLLQTEQIGSTWGRPTRILTPRILRVGVTARF